MTMDDRLMLLKLDLQKQHSDAFDQYLLFLLRAAEKFIRKRGIILTESEEDENIWIMYAAYLYRKRASENSKMPRMLEYALHCRQLNEKGDKNAI